ncbi:MAG: hypothetical protein ACR2PL_20400 [Dehalococcoidia bacterium]
MKFSLRKRSGFAVAALGGALGLVLLALAPGGLRPAFGQSAGITCPPGQSPTPTGCVNNGGNMPPGLQNGIPGNAFGVQGNPGNNANVASFFGFGFIGNGAGQTPVLFPLTGIGAGNVSPATPTNAGPGAQASPAPSTAPPSSTPTPAPAPVTVTGAGGTLTIPSGSLVCSAGSPTVTLSADQGTLTFSCTGGGTLAVGTSGAMATFCISTSVFSDAKARFDAAADASMPMMVAAGFRSDGIPVLVDDRTRIVSAALLSDQTTICAVVTGSTLRVDFLSARGVGGTATSTDTSSGS